MTATWSACDGARNIMFISFFMARYPEEISLDVEGMKELLLKLDYIQEELANFEEERKVKEIAMTN